MSRSEAERINRIAELLPDSNEMGFAVEYGLKLLGTVYVNKRAVDAATPLPSADDECNDIELWGTLTLDEGQLKEFLRADAAKHLKPGTRFQLRQKLPHNYGRSKGMAWYSCDGFGERDTWGHVPLHPEYDRDTGVYLVGEYVTPSA